MTEREDLERKLAAIITEHVEIGYSFKDGRVDADTIRATGGMAAAHMVLHFLDPAQQPSVHTDEALAWHCCDERYPWIKGIVTTSLITLDAWRDSGIKHQPLYPRVPDAAQGSLPSLVNRDELIALLDDLASVNLSREAGGRQARRMADDLIARGLIFAPPVPSQDRGGTS